MNAISIAEQIDVVKREIEMRKRVYRKRIFEGKMSQANATYEINVMTEVLQTLKQVEQPDIPCL